MRLQMSPSNDKSMNTHVTEEENRLGVRALDLK